MARHVRPNEVGRTETIEPSGPFAVELLPEPLRTFVNVGAQSMGSDPAYIALPLLAATASVIGNSRRIQLKPGWTEPAVIWTANVGESGTMKTPAFKLAMKPLHDLQRDELRSHDDRIAEYERKKLEYQKVLRTWKSGRGGTGPPPKPQEPLPARLIVSDVTVQALAPILKSNPRGVLMARDELAGWITSFDRYARGRGGDAADWLSMFNAETLIVDRKTGPIKTLIVEHAAVSVCGGIQPETLRRVIGDEHRENGLLARLLLASPPSRTKRWSETGIPAEQDALIGSLFDRLRELSPNILDDHVEPVIVRLTPQGKAAWVQFYDAHAQEQAELTGDLAAAWSKLEGYAARLGLIVHCVRWAAEDPTLRTPDAVDAQSVAAGVELARWFGREARCVYGMLADTRSSRARRTCPRVRADAAL